MTDRELLEKYARTGDLEAFGELLARHVNMVHGAARRQAPQAADDVVQAVFLLLAQKAGKISRQASISGWLYRAVGYCAANVKRMENRRRHYEREAAKMTQSGEDPSWEKLLPVLDQGLNALGPTERDAVLLHYLEAKSLEEMALELGTTADTAAKRASRGVQKLRRYFVNQGYAIPAATVSGLMAREAGKAAPAAIVKSTQTALAAGAPATSATVVSLMKGTQTAMAVAKIKAIGVAVAACLFITGSVAGVGTIAWNLSGSKSLAPSARATPILADVAPPPTSPPTTEPFSQATPVDTLRTLCAAMEANDKETIFQCLCDDGKDSFAADLARSFVRSGASAYHLENVWKEKFGTTMKVSGFSFEAFPVGTYTALFKDTMNTPGGPEVTIDGNVAKMRVSDPPEAFAGSGPDRSPDRGRWSGAMLIFALKDGEWKLNTYRTFNIGLDINRIEGNRADIMEIGSKFGRGLCDSLDSVADQIEDGTIKTQAQAVSITRTRVQRAFRDAGVDNAGMRVLPVIGG